MSEFAASFMNVVFYIIVFSSKGEATTIIEHFWQRSCFNNSHKFKWPTFLAERWGRLSPMALTSAVVGKRRIGNMFAKDESERQRSCFSSATHWCLSGININVYLWTSSSCDCSCDRTASHITLAVLNKALITACQPFQLLGWIKESDFSFDSCLAIRAALTVKSHQEAKLFLGVLSKRQEIRRRDPNASKRQRKRGRKSTIHQKKKKKQEKIGHKIKYTKVFCMHVVQIQNIHFNISERKMNI